MPLPQQCLAYTVLKDPDRWLGLSTPTALSVFLAGAELRAATSIPNLPSWRIHGPLEAPAFSASLVAMTGDANATISWPTALELLHFSMSDAMAELRALVEATFTRGGVSRTSIGTSPVEGNDAFWKLLATRPGMYLGGGSGWYLSWYLSGLTHGGDWLGLPEFPGARTISGSRERGDAAARMGWNRTHEKRAD